MLRRAARIFSEERESNLQNMSECVMKPGAGVRGRCYNLCAGVWLACKARDADIRRLPADAPAAQPAE